MSARRLLLALLFLGLGFALGSFVGAPGMRFDAEADPGPGRAPVAAGDPAERLERIEAAVARLLELQDAGVAAAATAPRPLEQPAATPAAASPARVPVAVAPLAEAPDGPTIEEQLAALRTELQSLRQALTEHTLPARFPTLEALRAAPEMNTPAIEGLHALGCAGGSALRESVRWLSQDEVLARYGRPSSIKPNGVWFYRLEGRSWWNVSLEFVEDYVVNATVHGCE